MLYRKLILILVFTAGLTGFLSATTTLTVTSAGDNTTLPYTAGELRYAISTANAASSGDFIINFNIATTGSAPVVIHLNSLLPPLNKKIVFDGTTQTGYVTGAPTAIIDGSSLSSSSVGLVFNSVTGGEVKGLYLRNFYDALLFSLCTGCKATNNVINQNSHGNIIIHESGECIVKGNYINTDANLTSFARRSEEGIFFTSTTSIGSVGNVIGGTACGEGNTILYTYSEGIDNNPTLPSAPWKNVNNTYSGNIIYNNTYDAIELRNVANGNKAAPVIVTTGCHTTGTAQPGDIIELFGSSGPASGKKNANVYMKSVTADGSGNWAVDFDFIPLPFITATATNSTHNTSELSPAKAITPSVLNFSNSTGLCTGTPITFTNISTSCGTGFTYAWNYGDGGANTTSTTHTYTTAGAYNVTLYMSPNIYCKPYSVTHALTITNCCPTCSVLDFTMPTVCRGVSASFVSSSTCDPGAPALQWNFGEGGGFSTTSTHTYSTNGTYTVTLSKPASGSCLEKLISKTVTVTDCVPACVNCIGSFAPEAGVYILSAWVKEEGALPAQLTYTKPQLYIDFPSTSVPTSTPTSAALGPFTATGAIIDGWQRIETKITIPASAVYLNIRMECGVSGNCLFDDIRVFPTDGSMKSYVYDPVNLRLVAELDERNYATFYEYDEEGKLIRVKKETEKGIMTIKENRNSTIKK